MYICVYTYNKSMFLAQFYILRNVTLTYFKMKILIKSGSISSLEAFAVH